MKIIVTVAIEHNGYSSEYGKAIEAPGEPSGIHEKAFHDLCDVVLYSAGGEFKSYSGEPLRHRKTCIDYRDPVEEFDVVIEIDAPDYAMPEQIAEALRELAGEVHADAGIDRHASDAETRP